MMCRITASNSWSCWIFLDFGGMVSRLVNMANVNVHAFEVQSTTWGDQFRNAMNVNGGDVENATHLDYVMHFLTFGWKVSLFMTFYIFMQRILLLK